MIKTRSTILPGHLSEQAALLEVSGVNVRDLFTIPETPFQEKFVRKNAPRITKRLSPSLRFSLTTLAKKLRNPSGALKLSYPLDFEENRILSASITRLALKPWWGKRSVLCLCHDVDNAAGHKYLPAIATQNLNAGIKATFNFLTHADYTLDKHLLNDLVDAGCEIGLHGFDHDQGFAFRDQEMMERQLKTSLEILSVYDVRGYRSPALSVSPKLFDVLAGAGFHYDSSLQIASPFYSSVRLPYPVFLEEYGIWEMPLMVQDDNYLRDTHCSREVILASLKRLIDETIAVNGVFVLNVHPHNMIGWQKLYGQILDLLKSYDEAVIKTMGEVVDLCQKSF